MSEIITHAPFSTLTEFMTSYTSIGYPEAKTHIKRDNATPLQFVWPDVKGEIIKSTSISNSEQFFKNYHFYGAGIVPYIFLPKNTMNTNTTTSSFSVTQVLG